MIHRLIELSLRNRFLVVLLYAALAGWGWWALRSTPIDAIPDRVAAVALDATLRACVLRGSDPSVTSPATCADCSS
jgi:Cu(I)/Ag(I) efflux system membrane protein CusA/SilA